MTNEPKQGDHYNNLYCSLWPTDNMTVKLSVHTTKPLTGDELEHLMETHAAVENLIDTYLGLMEPDDD